MAIDIKQEILDWYNENETGERTEYMDEAWEDFYYALANKEYMAKHPNATTATLASGPAYEVEDFGGEGQGDTRYVVFSVGDQFFRVDGYYASWDGTTWESPNPYEVEPVQVMVTEYHRKK